MASDDVFIGLGSNLGDREHHLSEARHLLAQQEGVRISAQSTVSETSPHGVETAEMFLNQVVRISVDSRWTPQTLLSELMAIEQSIGRDRERAPDRVIDLDLLYWGDITRETSPILPHPELPNRRFVLNSMIELAPDFVHPKLDLTQQQLLDRLVSDSETE